MKEPQTAARETVERPVDDSPQAGFHIGLHSYLQSFMEYWKDSKVRFIFLRNGHLPYEHGQPYKAVISTKVYEK